MAVTTGISTNRWRGLVKCYDVWVQGAEPTNYHVCLCFLISMRRGKCNMWLCGCPGIQTRKWWIRGHTVSAIQPDISLIKLRLSSVDVLLPGAPSISSCHLLAATSGQWSSDEANPLGTIYIPSSSFTIIDFVWVHR
uniref:HDC06893 n=1 Tax=Drosophila melanogaster TaxID=7227 RepID=Q6IG99_DROME|nr:TPA_inf: HDC06893 [Drosophila melanogaster]